MRDRQGMNVLDKRFLTARQPTIQTAHTLLAALLRSDFYVYHHVSSLSCFVFVFSPGKGVPPRGTRWRNRRTERERGRERERER